MEHDWHTFANLGLTAALSMLAPAPALASQGSALPCSGYWAGEMRGPHGRMLARAEVEMQFIDCGRALHIYTNGEAREFLRLHRMPNTYRRTAAHGAYPLHDAYVPPTPTQ